MANKTTIKILIGLVISSIILYAGIGYLIYKSIPKKAPTPTPTSLGGTSAPIVIPKGDPATFKYHFVH